MFPFPEALLLQSVGQTVGDVAIGANGATGTIYDGFRLAAGDDFDATVSRWAPVQNPSGKYAHSALSNCFRGTGANDNSMFIDPYYRGSRSESTSDLGFDRVSVASSVLTLTASAPDAGIAAYLPTTYTGGRGDGSNKPKLLTGGLKTAPYFMLSAKADFIVVFKAKFSSGVARGWWPGLWTSTFFWPDSGEIDVLEAAKNAAGTVITGQQNYHVTATDGGSDVGGNVASETVPTGRWVTFVAKKSGTTLAFYDDVTTLGTLASRGSTTTSVSRIRGAHDIRLELDVATTHDSSTFTSGDWPQSIDVDYWQAWVPSTAAALNSSLNVLTAVNTTPGGAWTATLPAAATISGGAAGLEQVTGAFDNFDAPGMPTRSATTKLPGGMSIDTGTRAVTGTVPSTEGGRVGVFITYAFDDGTPAKRYLLPFNVAPAAQSTLLANQSATTGASFSYSVAFIDFHSGNLGPHTYTASSDKAWATVTLAGDSYSFTITGTPTLPEVATITINCTNAIGQTTTVTRTVTASAAYQAWTGPGWFDASDGTTYTLSGSNVTTLANKRSGSGNLTAGGTASNIQKVTNAQNSLSAIRVARDVTTSTGRLAASNAAAVSTMFQGNDKPYTVIIAYKPTDSNTGFIWTASDTVDGTNAQVIGLVRRTTNASVRRQLLTGTPNDVSWGSGQASGTARIVAIKHTGTAVSVWDNSTTASVSASAQDVNTFNAELGFYLFQTETQGGTDPTFSGTQCALDFYEIVVESTAHSDADVTQAMTDLATKWGITLT